MRTASEMVKYCDEKKTGTGFTKKQRMKHFKIVENQLQDNEEVLGCFMGLHNYISMTKHDSNYGYAITNKRIIAGQKKVIGENVVIISKNNINDVKMSTGALMGIITFDTIKEKFNVQVTKEETRNIYELLVHQLFEEKETESVTINNAATPSIAEQLKEFKELLDLEIITQDEFNNKKKELLG